MGRDELNLAEFPIASISDRFLDGTKTVVLNDEVWDRDQKKYLPRKLTISGSDRYGLPSAKDDDVLLACVQLSSTQGFGERKLEFSRYELLKLLRLSQDSKNYSRLAKSLRRWKGTTIYSDRTFYDHAAKSWINRDFGIFDNLYLYEKERQAEADSRSWLVWNEVIFNSFQAGYLKPLDWNLYCRLKSPVAKRLYRFLDKRFYHGNKLEIDLHDLAFRKLRLSESYNTAQIKRVLLKGIEELETLWDLRSDQPERRFRKLSAGKWEAVFVKRRKKSTTKTSPVGGKNQALVENLLKRGVSPAVATQLASRYPADRIKTMMELHDWHNARRQERGAGFIVAGIRSEEPYSLPKGFKATQKPPEKSRNRPTREKRPKEVEKAGQEEKSRLTPFMAFWEGLDSHARLEFEQAALGSSDSVKLRWYEDAKGEGRQTAEFFLMAILDDHFEKSRHQRPNQLPTSHSETEINNRPE